MNKTISKNFRTLTREDTVVRCYLYGQLMADLSVDAVSTSTSFALETPVQAFEGDDLVTVTHFSIELSEEELKALLSSEADAVEAVKDVETIAPAPVKRGRKASF